MIKASESMNDRRLNSRGKDSGLRNQGLAPCGWTLVTIEERTIIGTPVNENISLQSFSKQWLPEIVT